MSICYCDQAEFGPSYGLCKDMLALIPYFTIPAFQPFPIDHPLHWLGIQPFGVMMAVGVFVGTSMSRRFAEKNKLDEDTMRWLVVRVVVIGFIVCHITNTLFYEPHRLKEDPLLLLRIWDGISSYGGLFGASFALWFLTRNFSDMKRLRWADWGVVGAAPGFMFGRIGCSIVHDHIGKATTSPFGIDFPPTSVHGQLIQGVHHDLGFYEVPVLLFLSIVVYLISKVKDRKDGVITGIAAIVYSVPRFFFEFYRFKTTDPTYFGLTPAQYFSIAFATFGVLVLGRIYVLKKFTLASEPDMHRMHDKPAEAKAPVKSGPGKSKAGSKNKKRKKR